MKLLTACACALSFFAAMPNAWAAQESLTAAQGQSVVDALVAQIQEIYVFPDKRAQIVDALRADAAKGRYATQNPKELADRLTETLIAASNDKHLGVLFDPQRAKSLEAQDDQAVDGFFEVEGQKWNQGYVRQEILPGNVRYVRIRMFFWTEKITPAIIDSAARFLAGGSAAVIDLRGNGGGHAYAVQRLISYLMPDKSTTLMSFFDGRTGKSEITNSLAKLPSPRISGRPIYVLIDRGTISAGEEFAYHIQQFKLGTLVGETTVGAANNNVFLPLTDGFISSISYGRPIHPVSKTNWEGVGVAPDKQSPSPAALDAALDEALTGLAQNGDEQTRAAAAWELPAVKARMSPVRVSAEDLKRLTGQYGEREIRLTGDGLTAHRTGRPPLQLTPMGEDLFAVVGIDDARYKFVRQSPDAVMLVVQYRDGRKQEAKREGKPG